MIHGSWIAVAVFVADWLIRIGLSVRVIMRRLPVGTSLAWLAVVLSSPFVGAAIYLMIGEVRLGRRRAIRARAIHQAYRTWLEELEHRPPIDWSKTCAGCEPLARLTQNSIGIRPLQGNRLELLWDTSIVFQRLIDDIDAAQRSCHFEFYIWSLGGWADRAADALLRAATRGVVCRVLVDAVGSSEILKSDLPQRLKLGGIEVRAALPVNLVRMLFVRFDLRLHRKIVVIDGEIAYTGSMNLVDPAHFKQDAGVGKWIDAMVRVEGPAVEALAITFLEDWELETGQGLENLRATGDVHPVEESGCQIIQVIPSGPATKTDAIEQILLMAIYAARRELVLTTPYFVPDEALVTALSSAASRGVRVTLVLPAKVDSRLVRFASEAHFDNLLASGVEIALFEGGLLHTKSITVDREFGLFGSLNLDPRSLRLNFEITLSVYDAEFAAELWHMQQAYLARCHRVDANCWKARSPLIRFTDNAVRLLAPLL